MGQREQQGGPVLCRGEMDWLLQAGEPGKRLEQSRVGLIRAHPPLVQHTPTRWATLCSLPSPEQSRANRRIQPSSRPLPSQGVQRAHHTQPTPTPRAPRPALSTSPAPHTHKVSPVRPSSVRPGAPRGRTESDSPPGFHAHSRSLGSTVTGGERRWEVRPAWAAIPCP